MLLNRYDERALLTNANIKENTSTPNLAAYRGDLVLARAAADAGVPMIMSGSSLIALEEIARANPEAWF